MPPKAAKAKLKWLEIRHLEPDWTFLLMVVVVFEALNDINRVTIIMSILLYLLVCPFVNVVKTYDYLYFYQYINLSIYLPIFLSN